MFNLRNNWLKTSLLLALTPFAVAEPSLNLTDQGGQPVPNAVVAVMTVESGIDYWTDRAYVMDQKDFQFTPRVLVIPEGAQVSFPNSDDSRHHVYSFSETRNFEIQLYAGNQAEPIEFPRSGIVAVGCNIHDKMSAHIYVTSADWAAVTDETGSLRLPPLPESRIGELTIWHADMSAVVTVPLSEVQLNDDSWALTLPFTLADDDAEEAPENSLRNRLKSFKKNDG